MHHMHVVSIFIRMETMTKAARMYAARAQVATVATLRVRAAVCHVAARWRGKPVKVGGDNARIEAAGAGLDGNVLAAACWVTVSIGIEANVA